MRALSLSLVLAVSVALPACGSGSGADCCAVATEQVKVPQLVADRADGVWAVGYRSPVSGAGSTTLVHASANGTSADFGPVQNGVLVGALGDTAALYEQGRFVERGAARDAGAQAPLEDAEGRTIDSLPPPWSDRRFVVLPILGAPQYVAEYVIEDGRWHRRQSVPAPIARPRVNEVIGVDEGGILYVRDAKQTAPTSGSGDSTWTTVVTAVQPDGTTRWSREMPFLGRAATLAHGFVARHGVAPSSSRVAVHDDNGNEVSSVDVAIDGTSSGPEFGQSFSASADGAALADFYGSRVARTDLAGHVLFARTLDFRPEAVALHGTSTFVAGQGSTTATLRIVRLAADGTETFRSEITLP